MAWRSVIQLAAGEKRKSTGALEPGVMIHTGRLGMPLPLRPSSRLNAGKQGSVTTAGQGKRVPLPAGKTVDFFSLQKTVKNLPKLIYLGQDWL
jgi:hypothetical protein